MFTLPHYLLEALPGSVRLLQDEVRISAEVPPGPAALQLVVRGGHYQQLPGVGWLCPEAAGLLQCKTMSVMCEG